jgi:VWFA-related protein
MSWPATKPVAGLTQEDLILRDRGRVQQITVFRTNSSRASQLSAPLPPGEFTNRPHGDAESSEQAIVIVRDRLNSYLEDAASGRGQVLKALGQIQTGDHVGLYALDADLHVIQDFTSDSVLLVDALGKYRESMMSHSLDTVGSRLPSTGESAGPTSDGLIPMGSLRLVVGDRVSGRVGSITIPVR